MIDCTGQTRLRWEQIRPQNRQLWYLSYQLTGWVATENDNG